MWVYGRFVFSLSFVMDDYIISTSGMSGPLAATLRASFDGSLTWSGYRPLTEAIRVLMMHAFGLQLMWPYFIICLGLHLLNTLLAYRLVGRVSGNVAWSFFAAAVVLLLPSHNESIFWFSAIANSLGLLFSLLALDFALTSLSRNAMIWQVAAVAAYGLAELSCEAAILLPILIFTAEWFLIGRPRGHRLRFYFFMAAAAVALLGLRLYAQGSVVVRAREDYGFALGPLHLMRGYLLIAYQMIAMTTSPYPGAPTFEYARNWLAFDEFEAWFAIGLTALLSAATFYLALHNQPDDSTPNVTRPGRRHLFWIAWGLLWIVTLGVPFAGLSGRNPENRYTYLLVFGMAVALTALVSWLYTATRSRVRRGLVITFAVALLALYSYTSTSDAHDWAAAGRIVQSTQRTILAAVPSLDDDQTIAQLDIPARVGSAYTFATDATFQAAIQLLYKTDRPTIARTENLRKYLRDNPAAAGKTFVFKYDEATGDVEPTVAVILCNTPDDCSFFKVARPDGVGLNSGTRYLELYDVNNPELGGVSLYARLDPFQFLACSFRQDWGVPLAEDALTVYPYEERCKDAIAAFLANKR